MRRAAFVAGTVGGGWLGGINYFRNLFRALHLTPSCCIQPVVLTGRMGSESARATFGDVTVLGTGLLDKLTPGWAARKAISLATGRDLALERLLLEHDIDLLSHSGHLGRCRRVPAMAWVPDLQHRHLPEFFQQDEVARRDKQIGRAVERCAAIVVSSEAARADLECFFPVASRKTRVLRFVDCSAWDATAPSSEQLEERYGFCGPYFILPNQFWAHKNHAAVVEALRILKAAGRGVLVLATGSPRDRRQPMHYEELMRRCAAAGVEDRFRPLGLVPYSDLAGLLRGAVAVVNPSLFEGWSTSVEEAKSLGKLVILSDIAVHREQEPRRGRFFPPREPDVLADLLWQAWSEHDPAREVACGIEARKLLPARVAAFAAEYGSIVRGVVG